MIQLYHVTKAYGREQPAVEDINLQIEKGEFCFLTGASGAGKTTLLKLIFGAERVSEGQILVGGRNISRLNRRNLPQFRRTIGVVFQDFKLLNSRTVFENVAFALEVLGRPRREIKTRVWHVLNQVGLKHKMNAYPLTLSGGEQQRVAIARAIINHPMLLLADEPTGNLDHALSLEIMDLFRDINVSGTTVLIATHALEIVRRYHARLIHLEEGRLATPERP